MTEERLAEIKHSYENACGVAYERWDYSQGYPPVKALDFEANEDLLELITEVEYLNALLRQRDRQLEGERKGSQRVQAENERLRAEMEKLRNLDKPTEHWTDIAYIDCDY